MKEKTKKYPFFWGPSLIQNTAYLPNKILAFPVDVFFAEHIIDKVLPNKNTVTSDIDEHRPQQQEILVTQQISEQDGVLPSSCQNSLDNTNVKQKERTSKRRVSKKKEKDVSCLQEQTKPNMAVQQVLDTLSVLPKPFYHEPFLVINEKYFNKMIDPAANKLFDFYHSVPAQIIHTLIHQGTKMPLPDVMNSGSNVFFEVVAIKTALNKYLYKVLCIIVDYNDVIYHFGLHKTLNAFKQLGDIVYKKEKDLRNAIDWPALSLEKMPVPNKKKVEMNNNKINVPSYAKLVPLSTFNTYFPCTEQPTYDSKMSRYKLPNSEGLIFLHTWNMNVKNN